MKILHKKISGLTVKRCFVVANLCAKRTHRGHMEKIESKEQYLNRLNKIRSKVLKMNESELDKIIGGEYQKRLIAYNNSNWSVVELSTKEVGVWSHAGELPLRWTNKSLEITADKVKRALHRKNGFRKKHIRAVHAVPGILKTSIDIIQNEKYLYPIAFQCDTGTGGRRRLHTKMKADIDDGCMRSIALAVNGASKITVYYGQPKPGLTQKSR